MTFAIPSQHGKHGTPAYNSWRGMLRRCRDKNTKDSKYYANIEIEDLRWFKFGNFYADMGDRPKDLTLERIDNNKGYYKKNCKWATRSEQTRNRSFSKLDESDAKIIKCMIPHYSQSEIADTFGVTQSTILAIKKGIQWA